MNTVIASLIKMKLLPLEEEQLEAFMELQLTEMRNMVKMMTKAAQRAT